MYKRGNNDKTQLPLTKWMTGIAGSLWARKHFLCQVSPNLKGTLALLRSSGTGRPVGKQMQSIWHSRTPHPAIRNVRTKNCHNLRSNPCNVTFDVSTTKLQLLIRCHFSSVRDTSRKILRIRVKPDGYMCTSKKSFFARVGRTILPENSKRSGRLSATN